jgi:hypothetical protein
MASLHAECDRDSGHKHQKSRKACCAPTPICQKVINQAGGTYFITESGKYVLSEDATGTLVVAADSVCLDLCCHTLDAGGAASAIIDNGTTGLEVFNGSIVGSSTAGISISNSNAIELFDLTMSNHALDAIFETGSTGLSVHDVNFLNNNSGERALHFDTCNNINVKNCYASGFLSTIGAVIQLDTCNAASIQDVDVSNCTKAQAVPTGSFATDASLVNMNTCTGVDLVHVKVNNNTANTTAVGNRRFHPIAFVDCNSCSMLGCETSNNTDISGDTGNDLTQFAALDRMVFVGVSDNIVVTDHQANNNSCTQPINSFRGYNVRDSLNTVFEGCQANSNSVTELVLSPIFDSLLAGFFLQAATLSPDGCIMSNCQANFNFAASGGAGRDLSGADGIVTGYYLQGSSVMKGCQANNNSMGDNLTATAVLGILVENTSNVDISNSTADANAGGQFAVGINILGFELPDLNSTVTNCSASSNQNYGFILGDAFTPEAPTTTANVVVTDSVFNQNGNSTGDAAGIKVFANTVPYANILIKGCQVFDTFGGSDIAGISCNSASNVVVEECNVFNTTAPGFMAHGILFNGMTDSKIISTQVHENQNSGIEVEGANSTIAIIECVAMDNDVGVNFAPGSTATCSLVQDSRALNNASAGFSYPAFQPLTVTFIGNEAQCNGPCDCFGANDYAGLNDRINLQRLRLSNGKLKSLNPAGKGAAALGARFTNLTVTP